MIDQAEKIYFEAFTKLGWEFVAEEPLWLTWTLQYFSKPISIAIQAVL